MQGSPGGQEAAEEAEGREEDGADHALAGRPDDAHRVRAAGDGAELLPRLQAPAHGVLRERAFCVVFKRE